MLISQKTTGSILKKIVSKEAYPIVRQLEQITVKKSGSESNKNTRETNLGSLGTSRSL